MAVELGLKKAEDCHWDALSLGEIMLRLDPGEGRIRTTRHFSAPLVSIVFKATVTSPQYSLRVSLLHRESLWQKRPPEA